MSANCTDQPRNVLVTLYSWDLSPLTNHKTRNEWQRLSQRIRECFEEIYSSNVGVKGEMEIFKCVYTIYTKLIEDTELFVQSAFEQITEFVGSVVLDLQFRQKPKVMTGIRWEAKTFQ